MARIIGGMARSCVQSLTIRIFHAKGSFVMAEYGNAIMLDDTDRRLMRHLLADPGLATADLAERAGVTAATCWRRLDRLRAAG
jgi:hypothetical protein